MPFSSILGAQSIIKPGVCTSSTRPASPYDGQVIYETDTDKTLVYNGTAWVYLSTSRANGGGIDLITSGSFSASSGVSLPANTFSSTYGNYLLNINITSGTSIDGVGLHWRGRTSGTDNSNSTYYYSLRGGRYSDGLTTTGGNGAAASSARLTLMTSGNSNAVTATFYAPQLTQNTSFTCNSTGRGSSDPDAFLSGGGYFAATTSFDSLTFYPVSGSITGTYEVYGYAK